MAYLIFSWRVVAEVVRLAAVGAEVGHLPEQPLLHLDAGALVGGIELAGLAAEILQDRARLEDRDRLAAGPVGIDDGGHAVVGRDGQELGLELVALADVDGLDLVGEPALLEHDRDLVAVGGGPVVQLDGPLRHWSPRDFQSSRCSSPGSRTQLTAAPLDSWIPGTSPGMTPGYGSRTIEPVVLRASRSACALAASFNG